MTSALLEENERVQVAVQGAFQGGNGVAVLTDRRLLLVNEREWSPLVKIVDLHPELQVQGWQDGRTASLTFQFDDRSLVIEHIRDVPLAHELATGLRSLAAASQPANGQERDQSDA